VNLRAARIRPPDNAATNTTVTVTVKHYVPVMVKALLLGLLLTFAALARAAPPTKPPPEGEEDPAAPRSERSANLSHVTGTARKIKMFIKNRHLQLLPGGTVNGTTDDTSPYSEFSI